MSVLSSKMSASGNHVMRIFSFLCRQKPLFGLEAIYRDGELVGFIRRAGYGFHIGKTVAYGYVRNPSGEAVTNEFLKTGKYQIESMGKSIPATFHLKTPFDPSNKRIKGDYDFLYEKETKRQAVTF